MNRIEQLSRLGQSIWYDYIRRDFLTEGGLNALIEQGVTGVTSNPAIFQKAIASSDCYDRNILDLSAKTDDSESIYEALAIEDIATAADQLRPIYAETRGVDGYVSLEVSPALADDTEGTIRAGTRLFGAVNRPNVMIKVPATGAGIPAVKELIGSGINVNVTLLFSVENYREAAMAYVAGLERLAKAGASVPAGRPVEMIASVASFFVSRVDAAVDAALTSAGQTELLGRVAIANAGAAYTEYESLFSGARWKALEGLGARPQRLLWASTGTKSADYPDTMYVDGLIGNPTVNTVPPATLEAFVDHGKARVTLPSAAKGAPDVLAGLSKAGIDLETICSKLQADGVAAFAQAFESLLQAVSQKRTALVGQT